MSNYQILEIVLEGLFFATVAAIAVIFVIIREKSIRKDASDEVRRTSSGFSMVMNQAAACMPSPEDLLAGPGARRTVIEKLTRPSVSTTRNNEKPAVKITRAEREFISSLHENVSRRDT